jgi:hypothetical protein
MIMKSQKRAMDDFTKCKDGGYSRLCGDLSAFPNHCDSAIKQGSGG